MYRRRKWKREPPKPRETDRILRFPMSFTACGRDWLKFQTKRGDVQQSVVTFVGNAILFWYFMRKMTKIKIMLTKHLKMWYDLYSVV